MGDFGVACEGLLVKYRKEIIRESNLWRVEETGEGGRGKRGRCGGGGEGRGWGGKVRGKGGGREGDVEEEERGEDREAK